MITERMAPGHPYIASLGTGIDWQPGRATIYDQGQVVATATHDTPSPEVFWETLAFRACFPQVTHWWFRSLWTGRVQVSGPDPALSQVGELWGWVTFDLLDYPRRPWRMLEENGKVVVDPPYPPNEVQPGNLPLRLALTKIIQAVFEGDLPERAWVGVTSLVRSEELETVFPRTLAEGQGRMDRNWQFVASGEETLRGLLRTELCRLLGVDKPEEPRSC